MNYIYGNVSWFEFFDTNSVVVTCMKLVMSLVLLALSKCAEFAFMRYADKINFDNEFSSLDELVFQALNHIKKI